MQVGPDCPQSLFSLIFTLSLNARIESRENWTPAQNVRRDGDTGFFVWLASLTFPLPTPHALHSLRSIFRSRALKNLEVVNSLTEIVASRET